MQRCTVRVVYLRTFVLSYCTFEIKYVESIIPSNEDILWKYNYIDIYLRSYGSTTTKVRKYESTKVRKYFRKYLRTKIFTAVHVHVQLYTYSTRTYLRTRFRNILWAILYSTKVRTTKVSIICPICITTYWTLAINK